MGYSDVMIKGRIGYNQFGWPLIVMERSKSDKPNTPVAVEVFGLEHECGSAYYHEIRLTDDLGTWKKEVSKMGHNPEIRWFKGPLTFINKVFV